MKAIKRAWPVLLWALLLAPFFVGALAAHPATDDFTFAVYTHPTWVQTHSLPHVLKDALSYTLRTWRDWQGTMTGVLVMALNPAVFSLEAYGVHAVILLALNLLAWAVFLRRMLRVHLGLPARLTGLLTLALTAVQLVFLPDIVEGIYWFNGAWFYTGAQAVSLLTLTAGDALASRQTGGWRSALGVIACAAVLFALGMDNYITAMMTLASLGVLAASRAWAAHSVTRAIQAKAGASAIAVFGAEANQVLAHRRAAKRLALGMLPVAAGLLLSVIAPGNAVRMATDGAHQSGLGWLLSMAAASVWAAVGYVVRFSLRTPLLALLLAATPALCRALGDAPRAARHCPPLPILLLAAFGVLCAMIMPHMYTSGYAGSGRVVNMYHDYVLLAMPFLWVVALMRMQPARRAACAQGRARVACLALACAALALCLLGGQQSNYVKLVRDQLDGTQAAYIAQFKREYALCEAAGATDDVALPAWTVQTMTGKPTAYEDATVWTNESMASYFGVRSVYVAP